MIRSKAELRARTAAYELPQPEPISHIPSVAIRQAVEDVQRLTAMGVAINTYCWGKINDDCQVCLAGASLLSRGYYGRHVERSLEKFGELCLPDDPDKVADVLASLDAVAVDEYAIEIATTCDPHSDHYCDPVDLGVWSLWSADPDADKIADAFDDVRKGQFSLLLCRHPDRAGDTNTERKRLLNLLFGEFSALYFSGRLNADSVQHLCTQLNAVADFLEKEGY